MRITFKLSLLSKQNHCNFYKTAAFFLSSKPYAEISPLKHSFSTLNSKLVPFRQCRFHHAIQTSSAHCSYALSSQNQQLKFEEVFDFSSNIDTLMATFKQFEGSFSENDKNLGLICLRIGEILLSKAPEELEKALSFSIRALEIMGRNEEGGSLPLVKALCLVGSISCKLNRFEESLETLETACQVLDSLEADGFSGKDFDSEKIIVQLELANTKNAMGHKREALVNLKKLFEMRMLALEHNSLELARICMDMSEAYAGVLEFREAHPLCLKALEIFEAKIGTNCEEVIQARQLIGAIHAGLGENEEALVQNELCREIIMTLKLDAELLEMEIESANLQINIGRAGEAMSTLKEVIQKAGKESLTRSFAFVSMAKALFSQERFGDSKGCLDMACDILNKINPTSPEKVAEAFSEISMLYEMMNEFEIAISLMKKALALLDKIPRQQCMMGSILARMGWLLLLTGNVPQAVLCLESAITKLKNGFGPKHFGLGFAYKHLGQAYLETGKAKAAIPILLLAKEIIENAFGLQHEDSIDACQYIANAYGVMERYESAMEFQQEVINRWEGEGLNAQSELREAFRLLQQLKKKAKGSTSAVFPANCLPQSLQK